MTQMTQDIAQDAQPDPTADYRITTDRPGPLRGESWITIQTRQAQRLVGGRKGTVGVKPIIGLTRFGSTASRLYVCATMDDPYAQWWLVKIEAALADSTQVIGELRQQVEGRLKSTPGFKATIAESLKPVRVPLKFANPYAYQAARLIVVFDDLMCALLTVRHVGLMGRDELEKIANLGARAVRRALNSVLGYTFQMISRKDIAEGNAKAITSHELMGEVPQEILDRRWQAEHAPKPASVDKTEVEDLSGLRDELTSRSKQSQVSDCGAD
jgi:integrating conjugative element protein (TIGR03761 family)